MPQNPRGKTWDPAKRLSASGFVPASVFHALVVATEASERHLRTGSTTLDRFNKRPS